MVCHEILLKMGIIMIFTSKELKNAIGYFDGVGRIIGIENRYGKILYGSAVNPYEVRFLTNDEIGKIVDLKSVAKYNEIIGCEMF
jgi:hypothetical protein